MVGVCPALCVGNAGGGKESAKVGRVTFERARSNPLQPDLGLGERLRQQPTVVAVVTVQAESVCSHLMDKLSASSLKSSRRRLSNARSFLLALPTMTDITGANNAENPVGVPRLRSDIRVALFSASHVYVVSMGKGAPGVRIVSRLPGTKSTTS